MPVAVLAAIVFMIGLGLVDIKGLRRTARPACSEFVIALRHRVVVFAWGVEEGIILAIALSVIELVRRAYTPSDFLVGVNKGGEPTYTPAEPGSQSLPGLLVFRFDSRLFYANASLFVDRIQELIAAAPSRVRWLILDCSSIGDIDYSASLNLAGLIAALHEEKRIFALADVDPELLQVLTKLEDPRALRQRAHLPDRAGGRCGVPGRFGRHRLVGRSGAAGAGDLPIMHIMSTR